MPHPELPPDTPAASPLKALWKVVLWLATKIVEATIEDLF
jgi:hypothetical protein